MNEFTISQLEQFSGVKAHTIRVWEQRYNALNPNRTNSNKRTYTGNELRRLLNIVSLIEADIKVSKVCAMSDDAIANHLEQELKRNEENKSNQDYYINQLISAGITYDDYNFEKIFSSCILRLGLIDTMVKVIYPLLSRIGLMWQRGQFPTGQEHFITSIICQKLHVAIDSLPIPQPTSEKWLLFLPENEFHEISLLLCNYIIKQAGKKVIYLGNNVPLDALKITHADILPDKMFFFLVRTNKIEETNNYLLELANIFANTQLYFSGSSYFINQLNIPPRIKWIKNVDSMSEVF